MHKKIVIVLTAISLFPVFVLGQSKSKSALPHSKASKSTYNGHKYDVFMADYPREQIKLFWKNPRNEKLVNFANLKEMVEANGHRLIFATNAGMFTPENSPKGLYIENGRQLVPIDLAKKKTGNFYMEPNGVFFLASDKGGVVTAPEFRKVRNRAVFATQSGPMLVIDGSVNPKFTKGSPNTYIRSGVGISKDGRVVFAISEDEVNFYDFASFFRDSLRCSNALYLDGAISKIYLPELGRDDLDGSFGAMIGIVR